MPVPYDYEMELKLRVIKAICGLSTETGAELWREAMLVLSDHPTLNKEKTDDPD